MYQCLNVSVVSACPDRLFETLKKGRVAKFIESLMEINVSFIAYESQVKINKIGNQLEQCFGTV